jgi:hypothetical protein
MMNVPEGKDLCRIEVEGRLLGKGRWVRPVLEKIIANRDGTRERLRRKFFKGLLRVYLTLTKC